MKPWSYIFLALCVLSNKVLAIEIPVVGEGAVTTSKINAVSTALLDNPQCLDLCVLGECVSIYGVYPLISHRLPDFVVSTHLHTGESAWVEMAAILVGPAKVAAQIAGGFFGFPFLVEGGQNITRKNKKRPRARNEDSGRRGDKHVFNGDVAVIGNSALIDPEFTAKLVEKIPFHCPISVTPYFPYYQSEFDLVNWRFGYSDLLDPESYIPGAREIGTMFVFPIGNTWGSVKPRISATIAQEPPLGAGVLAQRGVDIVTHYIGDRVAYPAPGVVPSIEKIDKWAMLGPLTDDTCTPFGSPNPLYSVGRYPDDHKYSYLYWGMHICCTLDVSAFGTAPSCSF